MFKKIMISAIALLILSLPFQHQYIENAQAAVLSKAGTLTAKKIVKEVIQEAAISQASNMAVLEAIEIADKYQAKTGYKIVCPSGGTTCDKPIQVKSTLTEADKSAIKGQSAVELDKLISPDGKGFSRWQSFLDWFLPIWLVTFAMTALTYAIDSDFRNLLNEAGYNALVALGIIAPVTDMTQIKPFPESADALGDTQMDKGYDPDLNMDTSMRTYSNTVNLGDRITFSPMTPNVDKIYEIAYGATYSDFQSTEFRISGIDSVGVSQMVTFIMKTDSLTIPYNIYPEAQVTFALNGEVVGHLDKYSSVANGQMTYLYPTGLNIEMQKLKSVMTRTPYKIGEFYYTDILYNTVDGNVITAQITTAVDKKPVMVNEFYNITRWAASVPRTIRLNVYHDQPPYKNALMPPFEEIAPDMDMVATTPYQSEDGERIALIPPTAITYQDETTGETVERKPNATGDGIVFQKPDGTIVPEENVVPNDPPEVVKDPLGVPTVTPAPTPSNPTTEPIPLTPGQTVTEPTPDGTPPATETPTEDPTPPDGEKCTKDWDFPKIDPLADSMSENFPFSVPWDIQNALESAFGDIGTERPSFELNLPMMDGKPFKIGVPAMFDDWKPFADTLLIFIFDIGIMFGIYRLVKGGG